MTANVSYDDAASQFWRRHIRVAFYILIAESVIVAFYAGVTPGAHRAVLLDIAIVSTVVAAISLIGFVDRVSDQPWRETFSFAWTLTTGVAAALVTYLDGGFGSALLVFIPLPVVFAALAFSPARVAVCGVASVIEFSVVSALGSRHAQFGAELLVWIAAAIGLTFLTVSAAANRSRLERLERRVGEELAELASTDGLTGCLNHRSATQRLDEEIARAVRYRWPLTVLVADIDHFKDVNDSYGHATGDTVLCTVAEALREDLRSGDALGRMGGDEFLVVLPHTDVEGGISRAERAVRTMTASATVPFTLSIGVASLDPAQPTARRLVDDADRALYHVKQTGRAGIAVAEARALHRLAS